MPSAFVDTSINHPHVQSPPAIPLSALQHFLYCPRQCALIHLEQVWAENRFTAEGRAMHERAHDGPDDSRPGVRVTRGLPLQGESLGLVGQADIVEFHANGSVLPVEYKRGKPKAHRADEVQLCAQALCLEEMLGKEAGAISTGHLFYGRTRRRKVVALDGDLRALTRETIAGARTLLEGSETPGADYVAERCDACSLLDLCKPRSLRFRRGAQAWFDRQLAGLPSLPGD